MKERYRKMMEQVALSDEAKARIAAELSGEKKAARRAPLRIVLAAACVCLALAVGALAVAGLPGVWLGEQESTVESSSYRVQAELGEWNIETMGQQLREDLAADSLRRTFDDRKSLEDYIGVSLIRSPLLEEAGIVEDLEESIEHGWDIRPELCVDPDARYVLTGTTMDGEEMSGTPEVLKVTAHRVVENAEVYLDARIVTDSADAQALQEGLMGEEFSPLPHIWSDFVRDENGYFVTDKKGRPKLEVIEYSTAEKTFDGIEHKMANGITATIVVVCDVEWDGSRGFQEYIGYFVSDGILYTIRPYAIYDPHQSFPMNDYDMLKVLKTVLDSFS